MSRRALSVSVAVLCCLAGAGAASIGRHDRARDRLPDWVRIEGRSYAGQTAPEVSAALEKRAAERLRATAILVVAPPSSKRRMWTATRKSLGATMDTAGMVRAAFAAANSDGFWDRVSQWVKGREPVGIEPIWRVDGAATRRYLVYRVEPVVTRPSRSARLTVRAGRPVVLPDEPGLTLDLDASVSAVTQALLAERLERVELPLVSVAPEVTVADATGITKQIASFETRYSERGNRRTNLEVACARINGTILKPDGVFSYNQTVGPRVAEAGFRMAPVIVRGRMEPGMGGGICQVSSTLYNAAMLAGLGIVSRSHHAFPVHYVPAGRDATVVYGAIDLKLRNTTGSAVGILSDASGGRVRVRFFGTPVPGRTIKIERTNVSSWAAPVKTVADPTLPPGKTIVRDRGHAGHRVSVWRVVRENGRLVRRELLSRDVYQSFARIVARGTAPKPVAPTVPQTDAETSGEVTSPPLTPPGGAL